MNYSSQVSIELSAYVPNGDVLLTLLWEVHEVKILKAVVESTPFVLG